MRATLSAIDLDLGDVTLSVKLRVHGLARRRLVWHLGVPRATSTEDRVVHMDHQAPASGRTDVTMDLAADMQVPLAVQWTDEVGNPTTPPPGTVVVAYTVDDPTLINLTDHGDSTANAAAVGPLGTANVHVDATVDGTTFTGDLQINVVAGLTERLTIAAGTPTEVTPD